MRKRSLVLLGSLIVASLVYLAGCGEDDNADGDNPGGGAMGGSAGGAGSAGSGGTSGVGGSAGSAGTGAGGLGGAAGSAGAGGGAGSAGAGGGAGSGGVGGGAGASGAGGSGNPCSAGETRCQGNTPQICGTNGTWMDGSPCGGSTALCYTGECIAPSPSLRLAVDSHTCYVTEAGGVKCWGKNSHGELGNGSTDDAHVPVDVVGLNAGVVGVSVGWLHTCALMDTGGVKCWGSNGRGQLGDGSADESSTPVDVQGLSGGAVYVSAGGYSTCAVTSAGGVQCWGGNDFGELGDGSSPTMHPNPTPVNVTGLGSGVTAVRGGGGRVCALLASGGVKCWGDNENGGLGDGTNSSSLVPVTVVGLTDATLLDSGGHACALTSTGAAKCWGYNGRGELGTGDTQHSNVPVDVQGLPSGAVDIAAGSNHTCATDSLGSVRCWGWNHYGQLGNGNTTDSPSPVEVTGLSSAVVVLAAGGGTTCVLLDNGSLRCWGENDHGQLGNDSTAHSSVPVTVQGM